MATVTWWTKAGWHRSDAPPAYERALALWQGKVTPLSEALNEAGYDTVLTLGRCLDREDWTTSDPLTGMEIRHWYEPDRPNPHQLIWLWVADRQVAEFFVMDDHEAAFAVEKLPGLLKAYSGG